MRVVSTAVLLGIACAGCATTPNEGARQADRNLLTHEDVSELECRTALEAVRRLRPRWLMARGPLRLHPSPDDYAQVVVDGMWMGDPSQLRYLMIEGVREMRFLSSGEATVRLGAGYPSGAIVVKMGGT